MTINLTEPRLRILRGASGPAGIVTRSFNIGLEATSEKRNMAALVAAGLLRENAHGDWYITDAGREVARYTFEPAEALRLLEWQSRYDRQSHHPDCQAIATKRWTRNGSCERCAAWVALTDTPGPREVLRGEYENPLT